MDKNKRTQDQGRLLDHDYDGIQELDNFLPRWWLGILYGSMIFAVGYLLYYWAGPGKSILTLFKEEQMEQATQLAQSGGKSAGDPSEAELRAMLADPEKKKVGATVYMTKCLACHGGQGQGGIGPNLTDDHWIHGSKMAQIQQVVKNGVNDKGMPPWGPVLSAAELSGVVVYVKSLRGTHPPNPKAPQGELVQE